MSLILAYLEDSVQDGGVVLLCLEELHDCLLARGHRVFDGGCAGGGHLWGGSRLAVR